MSQYWLVRTEDFCRYGQASHSLLFPNPATIGQAPHRDYLCAGPPNLTWAGLRLFARACPGRKDGCGGGNDMGQFLGRLSQANIWSSPGCTGASGPVKREGSGSMSFKERPLGVKPRRDWAITNANQTEIYIAYDQLADATQFRTLVRAKPLGPSPQWHSQAAFRFEMQALRSIMDALKA